MKVCVRMIVLTSDDVFNFFFVYLDMFYASLLIIHINGRIYNRTGQSPSQMNVNEKEMNNWTIIKSALVVELLLNWMNEWWTWQISEFSSDSHVVPVAKSRLLLASCFTVLSCHLLLLINIYGQLFSYLFFKGYSRNKHTKCINSKSKRINNALIFFIDFCP